MVTYSNNIVNLDIDSKVLDTEINFDQFAEHIREVLWLCNADGTHFLYLNKAYETVWGRKREEIYENPQLWLQDIHPDDLGRVLDAFASTALKGKEYIQEYRIIRSDGEIRQVVDHGFPIFDEEGRLSRISGIVMDITNRKKIEAELQIAQKLEAVGQLSAGIAHEINTPSQYVGDNLRFISDGCNDLVEIIGHYSKVMDAIRSNNMTETLLDDTEARIEQLDLDYLTEELPLAIEQALEGIQSISKIVLAMKEISHPGSNEMEFADINHLIENTLVVCKNEWKYVAEITKDLDQSLNSIPCFIQPLGQVFLNLIVNAAHAISEANEKNELSVKGIIHICSIKNDDYAEITISDNGCGIPKENLDKIFNQFFTTKKVGQGTGQGLSMAHNTIVEQHKGRLTCQSKPGEGTEFKILLPLIKEQEQ